VTHKEAPEEQFTIAW